MEMDKTVNEGVLVVRPKQERIFANTSEVWKEQLKDLVRQGYRKIVIDMEEVVFSDSSGIGAIIATSNFVRSARGEISWLVVANVNDHLMKVIQIMGINRVIMFFPSTTEAISYLNDVGRSSTKGTP